MEPSEAEELGTQVVAARERLGMSQAALASAAGVSEGTVSKVELGRNVHAKNRAKVLRAVGMAPTVEAIDNAPKDVRLVQQVVGMWLLGMPEAERERAVYELVRFVSDYRSTPAG